MWYAGRDWVEQELSVKWGPGHYRKGVYFFLLFRWSNGHREWEGLFFYVRDFFGVTGEATNKAGDERSKRRMMSGTQDVFVLHSHRDSEDRWT
jgi:hypothetical protein